MTGACSRDGSRAAGDGDARRDGRARRALRGRTRAVIVDRRWSCRSVRSVRGRGVRVEVGSVRSPGDGSGRPARTTDLTRSGGGCW
jgi:hypothetical protein